MLETFQSLDLMLQIFWGLAILSSVVFIIQAIGTFMGLDADTDLSADAADSADASDSFDDSGFHLVSFKSVISFILGFSWTGVLFWDDFENPIWLCLLATVIGLAFMAIIAWALYMVMKLDKDNTFRTKDTVGMTADVYLRIPAMKKDSGKITISLNGSMHELEAITESVEDIPTGAKVRILNELDGDTVLVERL
ncbi:MAG: serine protease [Bacteroidales bacterium]|nr:serine protease [Candidatus Liminaster caballi]